MATEAGQPESIETLAARKETAEQGKEETSTAEPSPTSTDGDVLRRRPSLSQHPLFAAKARGLRTRIMRFTPSWFSVTMVS